MRGMFEWAVEAEHVLLDLTFGVKAPPRPRTKGFPIWTEGDETKYLARWPLGTRQRVGYDVLRYSGLRRGDAVVVGKQHCRPLRYPLGTVITADMPMRMAVLRTEKSGQEIIVAFP